METIRILILLLYKAFLVRKRFWIKTPIVGIIIPLLILLLARFGSISHPFATESLPYDKTIYHIKDPRADISHLSYNDFYYAPATELTKSIMTELKLSIQKYSGIFLGNYLINRLFEK